jgi:hypothetical protein
MAATNKQSDNGGLAKAMRGIGDPHSRAHQVPLKLSCGEDCVGWKEAFTAQDVGLATGPHGHVFPHSSLKIQEE